MPRVNDRHGSRGFIWLEGHDKAMGLQTIGNVKGIMQDSNGRNRVNQPYLEWVASQPVP